MADIAETKSQIKSQLSRVVFGIALLSTVTIVTTNVIVQTFNTVHKLLPLDVRMVIFILSIIVYSICQYIVLRYVKHETSSLFQSKATIRKIHHGIKIIQLFFIVEALFLIFQLATESKYNLIIIILSTIISYSSVSLLMLILSFKVFRWISRSRNRTVLLYAISALLLRIVDSTEKTIEGCIGKEEVAMHVSSEPLWEGLVKLKERGVQIRIVSQVTVDNYSFCKTFSQVVDLKHVDGIQSSFGIKDGKWLLEHVVSLDEFPLSHAILTNVEKLVDVKRRLFETLWKQSIPAHEVFAKLEKSSPAEVNTPMDAAKAQKLLFNLITNSKYYIDMTIPTCNCFPSLVTEGLGNYLKTASIQGVKIRILLPKDKRSLELKNYLEKQYNSKNLEIKQVEDIRLRELWYWWITCTPWSWK